MINNTFFTTIPLFVESKFNLIKLIWQNHEKRQAILIFLASAFLVSVPVFIQAPLVRIVPWLSLLLTIPLVWLSLNWRKGEIWGDLLFGFALTWLTGAIYWGWLRFNPALHIPVEALALPFAIWFSCKGKGLIGNWFYFGSLLGTAITDLYFYLTGLIPYWREVMNIEPSLIQPLLQEAIAIVETPYGISLAIVLTNVLLGFSLYGLQKKQLHFLAFSGAVLSTILTDGLFLVVAYFGGN